MTLSIVVKVWGTGTPGLRYPRFKSTKALKFFLRRASTRKSPWTALAQLLLSMVPMPLKKSRVIV